MNQQEIQHILTKQLNHLSDNSFKSYDLCDITSQPYFLKMNKCAYGKPYGKFIKYPHNLLLEYLTPALRKIYRVQKRDFAQSNAFIVRGLVRLYQKSYDSHYLELIEQLVNRIDQQKTTGYKHACWGQPYDWFSGKVIPAFTPRTTVTSQVGKMYLDLYRETEEEKYLALAKDVGDFFIEEMPLSYEEDACTCYSYTTIDSHRVHNPNMMVCGLLAELWAITGDNKYLERALSAANFTFSSLRSDGSWYYALLPDDKPSKIDSYHTGYNIEGALLLQKYMGSKFPYEKQIMKAISYYESHLFDDTGIPYLTNKKRYPIDIQCCAQSIITYCQLEIRDKKYRRKASELFKWTADHMFEAGSYYYRIFKNGHIDKTDYVRWGDAWMFFAGSLLLQD